MKYVKLIEYCENEINDVDERIIIALDKYTWKDVKVARMFIGELGWHVISK